MKNSKYGLIYIDAFNLKSSGGITVYERIVEELNKIKREFLVVSNIRQLESCGKFHFVGTLYARDKFLMNKNGVLYLSNIPPLFKKKCDKSVFYLHQRYWIDKRGYNYMYSIKSKMLYVLKVVYWNVLKNRIPNLVVQTRDMRNLLISQVKSNNIMVYPVFQVKQDLDNSDKVDGCLIIGDNAPHKFTERLNQFVDFLGKNEISYRYVGYTDKLDSDGIRSKWYPKEDYWRILSSYKFVVVSSDFESFGLPLVESAQAGCVVIVPRKFAMLEELLSRTYTVDEFISKILTNDSFESAELLVADKTQELLEFCWSLSR